jgi:hypothetical protein
MEVTAFLANHAEAINNLLYANGAGITRANVPPGMPGPYGASLALGVLVTVPWTQTNQNHRLRVDLIDADGQSVQVPTGPETTQPFKAELAFNVGRPPTLEVGEAQTVALAIGMQGLPFPALGNYRFVLFIDEAQVHELAFKIATQPTMTTMPPGLSPTSIP